MNTTALLFGATGLTGSALLDLLLKEDRIGKVKIFVRKPTGITHPKLTEIIFDFEAMDKPEEIKGDYLFSCLGTTLKKAGSKAVQQKIDRDYPVKIAQIAAQNGVGKYLMVSSVGADARSGNFYLRTKGEMENGVIEAMTAEKTRIFRPSFLLGDRKESRLGEKIGIILARLLNPLFVGGIRKYKGIDVVLLSKSMLYTALTGKSGLIYEYDDFFRM